MLPGPTGSVCHQLSGTGLRSGRPAQRVKRVQGGVFSAEHDRCEDTAMAKRRDSGLVRLIGRSVWFALLLALMAMFGGTLLTPPSDHAAPPTGNYQLDVQVTNGPFSYGGSPLPQFQATLTAPNGTTLSSCTGSTYVTISIDTDPGTLWASTTPSASGANTCAYNYVSHPRLKLSRLPPGA